MMKNEQQINQRIDESDIYLKISQIMENSITLYFLTTFEDIEFLMNSETCQLHDKYVTHFKCVNTCGDK